MAIDRSHHELVCSVCHCEFDIELEGGVDGEIGILPVSLCAMCFSGLSNLFDTNKREENIQLRQEVNYLRNALNQKGVD